MKLLVEFDVDADIIDVPEFIVNDRNLYRKRFWKWLSNKGIKHRYWVKGRDASGNEFIGLCYRSDAFVEWLNKKVLKNGTRQAVILESHVNINDYHDVLPSIFF